MKTIALSEPTFQGNEGVYLQECLASTFVSSVGPFVTRFENEFASKVGATHAVACATGTAALHLALLVAGVEPGDEVFVSDLTFIATANAAQYCGARVTLIDCEPTTWNIDQNIVIAELNRRAAAGLAQPKAIVVAHILGLPGDISAMCDRALELGVDVIEDAAEALGARWRDCAHGDRSVGTLARFGCFSFNGNKIMTSGGGGMVVCPDPADARRVRHLSTQARIPGLEYWHDAVGYNYRLTNLAAAVGVAQLEQLDDLVERRRAVAATYDRALADSPLITVPPSPDWSSRTGWMYSVLLPDAATREVVTKALRAADIEARPIWMPLHLQAPYVGAPWLGSGVGEGIAARALSLPCSAHLPAADQRRVIGVLLDALA